MEDPRITRVDDLDRWVIAYTAFGPMGPAVALATTYDFTSVERLGVVRVPEDKNGSLLPRLVGGDFILLHRPVSVIGGRPGVWLSDPPISAAGHPRNLCSFPDQVGGGTRPASASAHPRSKRRRVGW